MNIKITDYWMGRDITHALDLSTQIRANAARTVDIANKLLQQARAAGVSLDINPLTGNLLTSGWRPPAVNASTPRAAVRSKHILGLAVDLYDPDGDLDEWCLASATTVLTKLGLWMEHPAATKGWCHLQIVPPGSKRRVFYP